ncbi:MAG: YicC family protein [Chitinispirillaceae bacterium]|nr:YicC family protein [Chitinispirillaceae bacterium]
MPIRSMTGFGAAEDLTASGTYRIEIRGVNNRFLEMQVRQPRFVNNLEQKVRKEISAAISRGSIQVSITCDRENEGTQLTWDRAAVENYISIFREIGRTYSLKEEVSLSDLLHFSDFLKAGSVVCNEEEIWDHLRPVLAQAVVSFQRSRETEGAYIVDDLRKVLDELASVLDTVEGRASSRIEEYAAALRERVRKLIEDPPDPQRMTTEIALCADRIDISEECSRLRAHIAKFREDFGADGPVGKRMGFLLQEMNREANTIGSKANDTEVSHLSVSLKEKIEKIREQIQNIE